MKEEGHHSISSFRSLLYGALLGAAAAVVVLLLSYAEMPALPLLMTPAVVVAGLRWGGRSAIAASVTGLLLYLLYQLSQGASLDLMMTMTLVEIVLVFTLVSILAGRAYGRRMEGEARESLAEARMEADLLRRHEDLYAALLSSISHDFRTPLASISGAAETLAMPQAFLSEDARQDMVSMIREEADRLNRFVANLLDMTKLESGALRLNREQIDVADIVGTAVTRSQRRLAEHRVEVDVLSNLPMIGVDFVLIEHVLTNLLENGAKYSAPGSTIRVEGTGHPDGVAIRVIDQGKGIPTEELDRVFEKFYRVQRGDKVSAGTGLGLSICQGIVHAHGGAIRAVSPVSQDGSGTMIEVVLPTYEESEASVNDQRESP